MLTLRDYQQRSLDALRAYFRSAGQHGTQQAFVLQTNRPYWSPPALPGLPYVCLRVPTGGGKTLMACHAVGLAARELLQRERVVCLWLVPSNAIREQTLAALQDREHPYRQALDAAFDGQVQIMELAEALYVQRSTLEGETCIVVSTLAALRVEDTEGRKVYTESGALQHHFARIPEGLGAALERRESGSYVCSLANVLRLWRPVVIMDEAHNARTPLSFDTLARFAPSCIVEFTATPETRHAPTQELFASNILHQVSASELKAEEMVKLPIKLTTQSDWKEAIAGALETRRMLQKAAEAEVQKTGKQMRPLVLFQAQPRSQERETLTAEVLKRRLMEDFKIPEREIAVATGQTRELDDVNLLDPACPVRYIITVYALKEGWDCSWAYVLCSVADLSSPRAVEQILGRILRLPGARRKSQEPLNCAYAFATSSSFAEAAAALKDALVENGFQRLEADAFVISSESQATLFEPGTLFAHASERVSEPPNLARLDPAIRQQVTYDASSGLLTLTGALSQPGLQAVQKCFTKSADQQVVGRLYQATHGHAASHDDPHRGPMVLKVPALAIRVNGQLELFEDSHFLDEAWELATCDAHLTDAEFSVEAVSAGASGEVDVDEGGHIRFIQTAQQQFALLLVEPGWTVPALVNWLDRQIPHQDIPQAQSNVFIHRAVTLEQLARQKFRLGDALAQKIDSHRCAQAAREYQRLLFSDHGSNVEVSPSVVLELSETQYAPSQFYDGSYVFKKHAFRVIGEMNQEEIECAIFLDTLRKVKTWVRNLDQRDSSFWLQTSTDRFYPDFVAVLEDGGFLVVEYKSERDWSNEDSQEKRLLGELWAERSNGRCLFVMPKGPRFSDITDAIAKSPADIKYPLST